MHRSLLIARELSPEASLPSENPSIGEKKFPFCLVQLILVFFVVVVFLFVKPKAETDTLDWVYHPFTQAPAQRVI